MGDKGVCRSCGAQILWVLTTAGKKMPLDADPLPGGSVAIEPGGRCRVLTLDELSVGPDEPRHFSHFATCPGAGAHRKPKGGA